MAKKKTNPVDDLPEDLKKQIQKQATQGGRNNGAMRIKGAGAKNPIKTLKRVLSYAFASNKLAAACVVVFILISSAAGALGSAMLQPIISEIGTQIQNAKLGLPTTMSQIIIYVCIMGGVYLAGALSSFAYMRIMAFISQGTLKKIRDEMFEKMQRLPIKYFDSHTHGELMSRYTNDVDATRQLLSQTIPQLISSVVTIFVVFFTMFYYSFTLLAVILLSVTIMILVVKTIASRSAKFFIRQQVALGSVNGFVEEMTEGQKVIKVFCHEQKAREEFNKLNDELLLSAKTANSLTNIIGPISNNIGYFQYILVAVVGALIVSSGNFIGFLSIFGVFNKFEIVDVIGVLGAFLALSRQFNMPIQQVTQQFNAIIMALAGAERIFDVTDTPPEDKGGEITLTYGEVEGGWAWKKPVEDGYEYVPLRGDIRFENVVFGYTEEKVILNDITLYAKPGQKIAFVGSTGAGKTTITNLINRFYDIQSGLITYDGIDIKDIAKDDLRRSLGVVLQDTHLFTGSVMENIRYGKLTATDEECIKAAKLANAHSFIKHLPDGYNTVIKGDGANLSQGQRQLLAIARAMVSGCPVLILDEATSSIDTRTEKLIEQGMDKLMEGKTVFVIAHRLSTVRNSHAIMVLEKGVIIERGNHEQLIEQKGKYYQLYTGAFELD